jgi:nicotinate-nucleotide pyrophosphorylase
MPQISYIFRLRNQLNILDLEYVTLRVLLLLLGIAGTSKKFVSQVPRKHQKYLKRL